MMQIFRNQNDQVDGKNLLGKDKFSLLNNEYWAEFPSYKSEYLIKIKSSLEFIQNLQEKSL